jgi:hypothetical protein
LGCGCTEHGQLGVLRNDLTSVPVPQPIHIPCRDFGMLPALAVACGDHTLVLCCLESRFPRCRGTLHTCNTALTIPDLLTLAKDASPLPGSARLEQDAVSQVQALKALTEAIGNVFSSPGLLIAGFSLPQPPPDASDSTSSGAEGQLNLDLAAIKEVYESILTVLNPDVVLALQGTIASLLQRIYQHEEVAAAQGRVSALSQAQWLKVCASTSVHCSDHAACLRLIPQRSQQHIRCVQPTHVLCLKHRRRTVSLKQLRVRHQFPSCASF